MHSSLLVNSSVERGRIDDLMPNVLISCRASLQAV